jgi:predicted nuclease with TOPRIM domain
MIGGMPQDEGGLHDKHAVAYQARERQLREAHITLADAVSALRDELNERRAEVHALRQQLESLAEHQATLEHQLWLTQNMKVVRWSAPLRHAVYRWRERRR